MNYNNIFEMPSGQYINMRNINIIGENYYLNLIDIKGNKETHCLFWVHFKCGEKHSYPIEHKERLIHALENMK